MKNRVYLWNVKIKINKKKICKQFTKILQKINKLKFFAYYLKIIEKLPFTAFNSTEIKIFFYSFCPWLTDFRTSYCFRLGWKNLPGTNTLAQCENTQITDRKSFLTLGPGSCLLCHKLSLQATGVRVEQQQLTRIPMGEQYKTWRIRTVQ